MEEDVFIFFELCVVGICCLSLELPYNRAGSYSPAQNKGHRRLTHARLNLQQTRNFLKK